MAKVTFNGFGNERRAVREALDRRLDAGNDYRHIYKSGFKKAKPTPIKPAIYDRTPAKTPVLG